MVLLAGWLALSVAWADDRFAAAVDAATIGSALSLLWATQQLVRSWRHVRIIAAVAFGVLLIYAAHGVIDRFVELPARQEQFTRNLPELLKNFHVEPGSFEANRLIQKIKGGEMLGFSASINTFASVMVLAGIVAAGALVQRIKDRQEPGAAAASIALMLGAAVVLYWTDSRTALATPFFAAMLFALVAVAGPWMNAQRHVLLVVALLIIASGTAFLVHHGLKTGTLFHDSLNFRWRYWVGAWGVWLERPIVGVGLDGFGLHYVTHRLAIASEEVRDPHNFIVRAFSELGFIGGLLTLLWSARAAWEMTRPTGLVTVPFAEAANAIPANSRTVPSGSPNRDFASGTVKISDFGKIAILFIAGTLLAIIASLDFTLIDGNTFIEVLTRLLYFCVGVIGAALVALQSMERQQIDDRPAPWIRTGMTVGVLIFLVHNLVDFGMFEYSAMFFAAMIAGAAWGVGMDDRPPHRRWAVGQFAIGVIAWLGVAMVLVVPTIIAEQSAAEGDAALQKSEFMPSARAYKAAFAQWPGNADYAFRAATALANAMAQERDNPSWRSVDRADPAEVRSLLDSAIAANPVSPKYYRVRAQFEPPDGSTASTLIICSNYEQALRIDPNSVDMRLEFAEMLVRLNNPAVAKMQFELALSYNNQLDPNDPKRLSAARVMEIRERIETLRE